MAFFDAIRNNPAFSAGVGGAVVGAGAVAIAGAVRRRRKKAPTKRKSTTTRKRSTTRPKSKTSSAFKKRRARAFRTASSKKIFFTKNGQPYIKLKSGKARFIKKTSASSRKKRKGGFR